MKYIKYTLSYIDIDLRNDFKTQPPVDPWFRAVSIVLNNDNQTEPAVDRRLDFEATPIN